MTEQRPAPPYASSVVSRLGRRYDRMGRQSCRCRIWPKPCTPRGAVAVGCPRRAAWYGPPLRTCGLLLFVQPTRFRVRSRQGGTGTRTVWHAGRMPDAPRPQQVRRPPAPRGQGFGGTGTLRRPARKAEAQRSRMKSEGRVGPLLITAYNAGNPMMHRRLETYAYRISSRKHPFPFHCSSLLLADGVWPR